MPQSTYITETDPSGALLQDLDAVLYTNFDLSYIPVYGHTYVAKDEESHNVSEYFRPYVGAGSLEWPGVMAVDNSNNLYISNRSLASYISFVSRTGEISNVFFIGSDYVNGMVFDASNILWCTLVSSNISFENQQLIYPEIWSSKIIKIDLTTLTSIEFVVSGIVASKMSGIVFDLSGNLFVADEIQNVVFKISVNTETTGTGGIFVSYQAGVSAPKGLACDLYNNLYVCNSSSNNVIKITPNVIITSIPSTGLQNPTGITYNSTNNCIYICNYSPDGVNQRVFVYQVVNQTMYTLPIPITTSIEYYYSIVSDLSGKLIVCGTTSKPEVYYQQGYGAIIQIIDETYTSYNSAGYYQSDPPYAYSLSPVTSVALNSSETELYVSQFSAPWPKTQPLDPNFQPYEYGVIWKIPLSDPSYNPVIFYPFVNSLRPSIIAVDSQGNIYLASGKQNPADPTFDKLLVIKAGTQTTKYVNITGPGLCFTTGMAFDNTGALYISSYSVWDSNYKGIAWTPILKLTFSSFDTATSTIFTFSDMTTIYQISGPLRINNASTHLYIFLWEGTPMKQIEISTGIMTDYMTDYSGLPSVLRSQLLDMNFSPTGELYFLWNTFVADIGRDCNPYVGYVDTSVPGGKGVLVNVTNIIPYDGYCQFKGIVFDNTGKAYISTEYFILGVGPYQYTLATITFSTLTSGTYAVVPTTGTEMIGMTHLAFDQLYTTLYIACWGDTFTAEGQGVSKLVISTGVVSPYGGLNGIIALDHPISMTFSSAGNLYVCCSAMNDIVVIDSNAISSYLVLTGILLFSPIGVIFDSLQNLWVLDYALGTLNKLTLTTPNSATGTEITITGITLNKPTSIAFNANETTMYICNQGANNIIEVNTTTWAAVVYNTGGYPLSGPTSIIFDNRTGELFITSTGNNSLVTICNNNQTNLLNIISNPTDPSNNIILTTPQGIIFDSNYNIYMANYGNSRNAVIKIQRNWIFEDIFDSRYDGISRPRLNVCDPNTRRIYIADEHDYIPVIDQSDPNHPIVTRYAQYPLVAAYTGSVALRTKPPVSTKGPFLVLSAFRTTRSPDQSLDNWLLSVVPNQTNPETGTPSVAKVIITLGFVGTIDQIIEMNSTLFDSVENDAYLYSCTNLVGTVNGNTFVSQISRFSFTGDAEAICMPMVIHGLQTDNMGTNFPIQTIAFSPDRRYMYFMPGDESTGYWTGPWDIKRIENYNVISSSYEAETFVTIPYVSSGTRPYSTLSVDKYGYLYAIVRSRYYRINPNGGIVLIYDPFNYTPKTLLWNGTYMNYIPWQNSLFISLTRVNTTDIMYLSFEKIVLDHPTLSTSLLGPYDDTLYINDVSGVNLDIYTFDFSFNIYPKYIIIDPSNIQPDIPTDTTIRFVMPYVLPDPTDVFILQCNGTDVSDKFCNNCTYNSTKFIAGTYPTSVFYSTQTDSLFVTLQNNTMSAIYTYQGVKGFVENDIIPESAGLKGPIGIVGDPSNNLLVLNTGGFISYVNIEGSVYSVDNSFVTGINSPISIASDLYSNQYLYYLSGTSPRSIITRVNIVDGSNPYILPLPVGSIYDPTGIFVYEFIPGEKYLYVSDTSSSDIHRIVKINLNSGNYETSIFVNNLSYKPYYINGNGDKYIYVVNKDENNISRFCVDPSRGGNTEAWASGSTLSVPSSITFDVLDNMYVANSGTGPRNSRVSKIYMKYFPFDNVTLVNGTCSNAQIYNLTKKDYVDVNYDNNNSTIFPIPFPYPIPNSTIPPPIVPIPVPPPPSPLPQPEVNESNGGDGGDGGENPPT